MSASSGEELHRFAARLYPICRSITGNGVRETLRLIHEQLPVETHEVPSGTRVFDWEVPPEWNIEQAALIDPDGRRVVDFNRHNLHVVGYSEPRFAELSLEELAPHLHSMPDKPDWIPYRTSYYRRNWGFCLRHSERERLRPGKYRVEIDSALTRGSLTYGEALIRGTTREEVLFFAHVCHPSLANDNTSGIAVATALARWIASEKRRYSYRFVFAPGTIGSLCWLKRNEHRLARVRHGLVLALLGDPGPLTYKMSRREGTEIDAVASYVLARLDPHASVIGFSPYGYDERQLCSPGFDLPVGRLTRSVNGGYPEYHSSGDDLALIRPEFLQQSYEACQSIVTVLEGNRRYVNLSPRGEPRLGKRGLYGPIGGFGAATSELALLWVLNQSDGTRSLLDVTRRSGMDFTAIHTAAIMLERAGLLRTSGATAAKGKRRTTRASPKRGTIRGGRAGNARRGGKK
jgi:aminopeptidase-like protein